MRATRAPSTRATADSSADSDVFHDDATCVAPYGEPPVIQACRPNSPAFKAGLKAGDRIVSIDSQPTKRMVQLRQVLNPKYAGDTIQVVVARGEERIERSLQLVDKLEPYQRPFLGMLPMRNPAGGEPGVIVRYVYPESPAARAGA